MANIKLNRLKKINYIDVMDRDYEGAVVYIDGEIVVGRTHAKAISKYIESKIGEGLEDDFSRPSLRGYLTEDAQKITDNIKQMAFAHKVSDDNAIYIEGDTLYNVDLNTVAKAIKEKFSSFDIYVEETYEKVAKKAKKEYSNFEINTYKIDEEVEKNIMDLRMAKINRLKKLAWHDVGDRDCALAYIDGEVLEDDTHALCINKYLKEHYNKYLNDTFSRPNVEIEADDAWDIEHEEDLQNIYDNIQQICFGHVDKTNKTIYLEPNGLNVSINNLTTIGPKIKEKYPDFNIVIDNADNENFEQVARLKKKSYHAMIQ